MAHIKHSLQKWRDSSSPLIRRLFTKIESVLRDPGHLQALVFWTSSLTVGFCAVAYAYLFHRAEDLFQDLVAWQAYSPIAITPILFLIAWWVVKKWAPEAAGSGIPQIMAANELPYTGESQKQVHRLLSLKTALIKVISSLICVVGGGAIGREGPTLQVSASIFHFFGGFMRRFLPQVNEHTWVVAGAASGLASAFNTPLGGIVYAIEELGLVHFHKIRTALISGVIVSGLMAQWLLGSYLYLGFPILNPINFSFLPTALLNGIISGFLGACFGKGLLFLFRRRSKIKNPRWLALATLGSGLCMGALLVLDRRSAGTGIDLTSEFLFKHQVASLWLVAIRFVGTMLSYLSGAAGGIFSPSLSIGATVGSYLASILDAGHPNLMVLLGMIGFLTGVTRTPFTSFILVLEMTDRHSTIFPMMLSALAAQWVALIVDKKSFYEGVKEKYMQFPGAPTDADPASASKT